MTQALTDPHPVVVHPDDLIHTLEDDGRKFLAWNDRLLDWLAQHVLASMAMFDLALVLPLLAVPAPDGVKITLALFSGSWIQWWALPALQRSSNKVQRQNDAKAAVDHQTLTHLANIQDLQMQELKLQTAILQKLQGTATD